MYHYTRNISNSRYPGIKGLEYSLFREQIEFMKHNFNIVTMEQVIDSAKNGSKLPERALLLTFDDGYLDNYTVAMPVLEEFGAQGSFFISAKTFAEHKILDVNKIHYTLAVADMKALLNDVKKQMDYYRGKEFDYPKSDELFHEYGVASRLDTAETIFVKRMLQTVLPKRVREIIVDNLFEKYVCVPQEQLICELYMNEDQIKTLKRHGMYIGVHGYDHYWLTNLPKDQMEADINKALNVMDHFIDKKCWAMNYPYGDYNREVADCVKDKGACVGFTTDVRVADLDVDDLLMIPRLDCNDYPPKSENYLSFGPDNW